MYLKKLKILSWNTRGLGDVKKCNVVKNVIRRSRCDIVCIQETKWSRFEFAYAANVLPNFFNRSCVFIDAQNAAGGVFIAWKHAYTLQNSFTTRHTCTVVLKHPSTGSNFAVTTVYGSSRDEEKEEFIREVSNLANHISIPWIMSGDFNLVRWLVDRSGNMRGFGLMFEFNDLIRELQLIDVQLQNRDYTWSNKQPVPIFSKLDRCFLSSDWALMYPIITLTALEIIVSDHVPLLYT